MKRIGKCLRIGGNTAVKAGQAPVESRHLLFPGYLHRPVENRVAKTDQWHHGCNSRSFSPKNLEACYGRQDRDGVFTNVELMTRGPISPHPDTILGRIIASKAVVEIEDARKERGYLKRLPIWVAAVEQAGALGLLGVPMLKQKSLVGAFVIFRSEVRPFTEKQIGLVKGTCDL